MQIPAVVVSPTPHLHKFVASRIDSAKTARPVSNDARLVPPVHHGLDDRILDGEVLTTVVENEISTTLPPLSVESTWRGGHLLTTPTFF